MADWTPDEKVQEKWATDPEAHEEKYHSSFAAWSARTYFFCRSSSINV